MVSGSFIHPMTESSSEPLEKGGAKQMEGKVEPRHWYLACQFCQMPVVGRDQIIREKYEGIYKEVVYSYELDVLEDPAWCYSEAHILLTTLCSFARISFFRGLPSELDDFTLRFYMHQKRNEIRSSDGIHVSDQHLGRAFCTADEAENRGGSSQVDTRPETREEDIREVVEDQAAPQPALPAPGESESSVESSRVTPPGEMSDGFVQSNVEEDTEAEENESAGVARQRSDDDAIQPRVRRRRVDVLRRMLSEGLEIIGPPNNLISGRPSHPTVSFYGLILTKLREREMTQSEILDAERRFQNRLRSHWTSTLIEDF
ncbi:hypothetical protein FOZ63_032598 [Perkinsus olseni]|uniref:Uncharacterized protein n=2 Tax=Perkinsus olseni TaxID=32597 RepID=A0A7J6TRY3_PEROL|nr:hypothetical protein FOZ63_032598 [Perkinsus olseni]KAF4748124.1 hypothetical protein FOZ62_011823 [Perkinsus olseni]